MNYIVWKGEDSRELKGLIICELPPISKPKMRVTETAIDGVDGSIIEELGYSSYDKALTIGLTQNADINAIIKYFTGSGEVVFSNEASKYYKANIIGQIDFARLVRFRTATVIFRTQPFKYLVNEEAVTTGSQQVVESYLITNGVYADGTNVTTEDEGENWEVTTKFIEVNSSQQYSITGTITEAGSPISVYQYNEGKTLLYTTSVSKTDGSFTFVTLSNAKYIKFDAYTPIVDWSTVNLTERNLKTNYTVWNNGNQKSKPLIRIVGAGQVDCIVNGNTVFRYTFPENVSEVYIDSELQDAYLGSVLKNRNMAGDFPILQAGKNTITFDGTVTEAEISARSKWI